MPDTLLTLKHPSASISLQFANGTDGAAAASNQTIGKIDFDPRRSILGIFLKPLEGW